MTWSRIKRLPRSRLLIGVGVFLLFIALGAAAIELVHSHLAQANEPPFSPNGHYLDAVGPVYAQEVAYALGRQGKLPVNGHEYLHEVGEYIYEHYGPSGAKYCRPYFDHACYNGLTIHMTSMSDVAIAVAACNQVDSDTMLGCIHGGGHAALFLSDYDVPKALALCSKLAEPYPGASALNSCSFGVFMELRTPHIVSSFATDTPWYASRWRSVACDDPRIAPEYQPGCWRNDTVNLPRTPEVMRSCLTHGDASIPSCLRGVVDGRGGLPFSADYAFENCDAISGAWRDTCLIDFVQRNYMNGYYAQVAQQICERMDGPGKTSCEQTLVEFNRRFAPQRGT